MSNAVVVENIYKKFGRSQASLWEQFLRRGNGSSHPGNNGHADLPASADLNDVKGARPLNGNGSQDGHKRLVVAVDRVSFTVQKGEIFGVLGPNGGGKSTLIRLIATLLLPDDGFITVFGYDVVRHPLQVQRLINRVSVEASFFKKLSPMENLLYGARLYGLEGGQTRRQVVEILTRLGLDRRSINNPMEEMSRGMQQKVAIARALLTHPRLLLLDEPTTGLDPQARHAIWDLVRDLKKQGVTILLTTHYMEEAAQLCDRVVFIDDGRILMEGPPAELVAREVGREVMECWNYPPEAHDWATRRGLRHEESGGRLFLYPGEDESATADFEARFQHQERLLRSATLEDVFLKLTGRVLRD